MFKGTGELYIDGKKVAEKTFEKTTPGTFSLSETFDVGVDNGTPVSNNYKVKDHFRYTGVLDKVVITLLSEDSDLSKEPINPGVD
jgi:arylsulfatase